MRSLSFKSSLGRSWESLVECSSNNPEREEGPGQWAWEWGGISAILGGELEAFDDRWDVPVKVR